MFFITFYDFGTRRVYKYFSGLIIRWEDGCLEIVLGIGDIERGKIDTVVVFMIFKFCFE